jgi:hypothetical protein
LLYYNARHKKGQIEDKNSEFFRAIFQLSAFLLTTGLNDHSIYSGTMWKIYDKSIAFIEPFTNEAFKICLEPMPDNYQQAAVVVFPLTPTATHIKMMSVGTDNLKQSFVQPAKSLKVCRTA